MRFRESVTTQLATQYNQAIAAQFKDLDFGSAYRFHIYLPLERKQEVNTELLLPILMHRDREIILPRMNMRNRTMQNILLEDDTRLAKNKWGITEPQNGTEIQTEDIHVVIVPLLAYDRVGNRLGYGGGFYDRMLANTRHDCLKIGLSWFPPHTELLPTEPTDIPLDMVVSPQGVHRFVAQE